jgi:parvulin-like peptidyl-prolyl isomerase/RNA polymerase subunit RPABC4/transcription elongation factor Spt4
MIFCQQCGTSVMENQSTCPNCGAEITPDAMSETLIDPSRSDLTAPTDNAYATAPNEAPETNVPDDAEAATVGAEEAAAGEASAATVEPSFETDSDRTAGAAAPPVTHAPKTARPSAGGMSATAKALIAAGVAVVLALGFLVWQLKGRGNEAINVTSDDMAQIVSSVVPPQGLSQLAKDAEQRKEFAKQIRQVLAIGQEARAAGYADKPEVQRQLETMKTFVLAQMYSEKQKKAGVTNPEQLVSNQEIENFIKEPGQQQRFDQFLQDVQTMGLLPSASGISDQQKEQIEKNMWGPAQVLARKAQTAGVDKERATQLMMKLQEAQVLAQKYLPTLKQKIEATDQEIDAYIAKHPELDSKQTRAKADDVLKRVKSGEDFGTLAKEFSTDPGSKDKGGELGWFKRGMMVKPFEEAAFGMQPGQTSDIIETQFGFHIIQTEEKRTAKGEDGKDEEEVRARHILVGYPAAGGGANPFGPPQAPREQAKAAVEKEKREKLIDDIAARQHVTVAEDFKVEAPPAPPAMPGEGLPGEDTLQPPGGEPEAPPAQSPHGNATNTNKAQPKKK